MFKSISYLIDVNNGTVEATNRFDRFLLYVTYFPEVSMGPISRAVDFLPQIETEKHVNAVSVNKGLALIAWGFFKKIVFADMLASMISPYYTDLTLSGNGFVWFLAAAGFLLQLYLDFSAYTDISIGVSTMLGYNIKPNFKAPFFALSISEFWRRWHITLSSWLLDYVFTPLQFIMRKLKRFASVIPALITFTLIGVWHGGTSAYLVFGFLMGVLVAIDSLISKRRKKLKKTLPKPLFNTVSIIITILVNILVFVFMKAGLASDGFAIIGSIFRFSTWSMSTGLGLKFFIIFGLSIVVTVLSHLIERKQEIFLNKFSAMKQPVLWLVYLAVIFVVILFGYYGPGYDPIEFIYIGF
jgi:D-alanyl-lipoteichoic acid acyltransferase DltB (MBOAT superfamily)